MTFKSHLQELEPGDAAAFRDVAARLRALPECEPSASLDGRILAAVDAEREGASRHRWTWRWAAAAAAAAVAAAAGAGLLHAHGRAVREAQARAGLDWLAESQEADGTWSPAKHGGSEVYRPALTALAALALERGGPEREVGVRRACDALVALQAADGSYGGAGRAGLYNQAFATYALANLGLSRPVVKPALERALAAVRDRQTPQGGWDYAEGSAGNAALTAWLVRALACAESQGCAQARVPLRKGLRWLRGSARDDGSVSYHAGSPGRSDALTALAAYVLLTVGKEFPGLPELGRLAVGTLREPPPAGGASDCYRDYARVLALDSAGQARRANALRTRMLSRQSSGAAEDLWASAGGRVYTTALTALAAR